MVANDHHSRRPLRQVRGSRQPPLASLPRLPYVTDSRAVTRDRKPNECRTDPHKGRSLAPATRLAGAGTDDRWTGTG
jgi:hypothetical protein